MTQAEQDAERLFEQYDALDGDGKADFVKVVAAELEKREKHWLKLYDDQRMADAENYSRMVLDAEAKSAQLEAQLAEWKPQTSGEANGCVPCFTCGGFKPPLKPCAFCAGARAALAAAEQRRGFDLIAHIERQKQFSENTFGPGHRTLGVLDHIRKELKEVEASPLDLEEWVDVILLAIDGAWRSGATARQIAHQINAKQTKNESRIYPDWRTAPSDKAIEHVRDLKILAAKPAGEVK